MPKKVTWEDFQNGKEYKMWGHLFEMTQTMDLSGVNFIKNKETGSGVYWEPFLVLLFKFGNMLKQTGKLKEIKMDWIRPLNYLEAQSNEHVVYDNENYIIHKGAMSNAVNARYAFQHLLDSVNTYETLNETNFQKDYKTLALTNINLLVQEDIRDMLLLGIEEKMRNEKVTEKDKHQLILSTSSSKDESKEEHGKAPINRRSSKIVRSQKTLGRVASKDKVPTKRKKSKRESLDGDENEFLITLGKKTEALRPPSVWNFPIERIETNSTQVSILKKEMLKTEIRKANPFASYHDQRVKNLWICFMNYSNTQLISVRKKVIYGNIRIQKY